MSYVFQSHSIIYAKKVLLPCFQTKVSKFTYTNPTLTIQALFSHPLLLFLNAPTFPLRSQPSTPPEIFLLARFYPNPILSCHTLISASASYGSPYPAAQAVFSLLFNPLVLLLQGGVGRKHLHRNGLQGETACLCFRMIR